MAQAAAKTGVGPTAVAAVESHFPREQRILDDALASAILPSSVRRFAWFMRFAPIRNWMVATTEKRAPGLWAALACRKRHIDVRLLEAVDQVEAVVNLGAGFDTRAYRFPALAHVRVWEVDQAANITPKRQRVTSIFGAIPAHVTLVAVDFDHEELGTVLAAHDYSLAQPTFFISEAVTQYLTERGVRATFDFLAQATPGSRLAFTYVRKDFIDGRARYGQVALYEQYVGKDRIWLYGMEPERVADFLEGYGWRVLEHVGAEDLAPAYVTPTGRQLATTPLERLVYAEKV